MHRPDFTPCKRSVVCSDHFECFYRTGQTNSSTETGRCSDTHPTTRASSCGMRQQRMFSTHECSCWWYWLPQTSKFIPTICTVVLKEVGRRCFKSLDYHMFDSTPDNNHIVNVVKCTAHCYAIIRMHHLAKEKYVVITGAKVCKQLTKLVLFKGQYRPNNDLKVKKS